MDQNIKSREERGKQALEDEKRKELQKVIFEDKKKPKKNIGTNFILFLVILSALLFSTYTIYNSFNEVNQIYQVVNAIFIFLITICFVIAFKKASKKKKVFGIITSLLLIIFMGFNISVNTNLLTLPTQNHIPDFTSGNLEDVIAWTEENNIDYNQTYEYSDNISKNDIITQDVKANTLTKNIKKLNVSVSNGPDYSKEIILPNMEGSDIDYE